MPKVWNKRDPKCPKDAVYVGRPTKWGNPYSHLPSALAEYRVATREEAIERYRQWFMFSDLRNQTYLNELRGKDLVCWCAPKACHADILLELANS